MLKEFKEFISRGNVVDMAVGIIIGAAFTTIVKSLVDDVIMPPLGLVLGKMDFSNLYVLLKDGAVAGPYASLVEARKAGAVVLGYGLFANAVLNFLIVAAAVFALVKAVGKLRLTPLAPPPPATKDCPFCFTKINPKAVKCPQCTADLPG